MVNEEFKIEEKPLAPLWDKSFVADKNLDRLIQYSEQKGLSTLIRKCHLCNLCSGTHIGPTVVKNPKAIFIGRNPSSVERSYGDIYDLGTRAGQVFQAYLGELCLSYPEVYITNVCHCTSPGNRQPLEDEERSCAFLKKIEFSKELDIFGECEHIFLMGNDAMKLVYGSQVPSILSIIGTIYKTNYRGRERYFYPVSHPTYLCMDERWRYATYQVLKKAREIMNLTQNG